MSTESRPQLSGEQLAEISNAIVKIYADCYGRGPTRAKSFMHDNYLFTVLEDLLTPMEVTLVNSGRQDLVREVRITFQAAVAERFTGAVGEIVGRRVLTYQSQVLFDPAVGVEIFVLEP